MSNQGPKREGKESVPLIDPHAKTYIIPRTPGVADVRKYSDIWDDNDVGPSSQFQPVGKPKKRCTIS